MVPAKPLTCFALSVHTQPGYPQFYSESSLLTFCGLDVAALAPQSLYVPSPRP